MCVWDAGLRCGLGMGLGGVSMLAQAHVPELCEEVVGILSKHGC